MQKAAAADAKYKMVAQWNNCHDPTATSCLHPITEADSGVYMMKSADGVAFLPMFGNRSLDWSDTKNVMWYDAASQKYVAYIRIDNGSPDPHWNASDPCEPWLNPGRRVGKCLLAADQLHDWSLAGCTSKGPTGDIECSIDHVSCAGHGPAYHAARCNPANDTVTGTCAAYGTCGNVHAACNTTGFCVVPRGSTPGAV